MFWSILLVVLGVGLHQALGSSLNPVTQLVAVQEGFDGIVSLSWKNPVEFPRDFNDIFKVTVTNQLGRNVGKQVRQKSTRDLTTTSITVEDFTPGERYTVTVTPMRYAVKGLPTSLILVSQKKDTAIPSPTNLRYERSTFYNFNLMWDWKNDDNVTDTGKVWFFIRICAQPDETFCQLFHTTNLTVSVALSCNLHYKAQVFAHRSELNDTSRPRTSEPVVYPLEINKCTWPIPENRSVTVDYKNRLLNNIPVNISWNLEKFPYFMNVIVEVYERQGSALGRLVERSTNEREANISVMLDYGKPYAALFYVAYERNNKVIDVVWNHDAVEFDTPPGPSTPVRNLKAIQVEHTNEITLTWDPPMKTNGNLTCYELNVKAKDGDAVMSKKLAGTATSTTVRIEKVKFGSEYEFSVTPINEISKTEKIIGLSATTSVTLEKSHGLSAWVIVLIVVLVLTAVAGGAYYFMKMRR